MSWKYNFPRSTLCIALTSGIIIYTQIPGPCSSSSCQLWLVGIMIHVPCCLLVTCQLVATMSLPSVKYTENCGPWSIMTRPGSRYFKLARFLQGIRDLSKLTIMNNIHRFLTPIYHPNITRDGEISGVNSWQPSYTLEILISQIRLLLAQPNWAHKDALQYIVHQNTKDKKGFEEMARALTRKYAMRLPSP